MRHEARQLVELAPEPIDLVGSPVHRDRLRDGVGTAVGGQPRACDQVRDHHARDRGRRRRHPALSFALRRSEQGKIDRVARHSSPEPPCGAPPCEDADAACELTDAESAHKHAVFVVTPKGERAGEDARERDLRRAEREAEPAERARKRILPVRLRCAVTSLSSRHLPAVPRSGCDRLLPVGTWRRAR